MPGAGAIPILYDAGGQQRLSAAAVETSPAGATGGWPGLKVTVSHYSQGASKYNPVENRPFSFTRINCGGKPLRTLAVMLGCSRGSGTQAWLRGKARLVCKCYKSRIKATEAQMAAVRLKRHETCPSWNYTIKPNK